MPLSRELFHRTSINHSARSDGSFADHEPGLWRAVITQALIDAASRSRKSEAKHIRSDAMQWLLADSGDFEAVCDNAGLDPDYVRSRARKAPHTSDFGTPELRLKHAHGMTTEPIDLCLERALITPAQHWSGLHLRWLHTLRYGAAHVTTRYSSWQAPGTPADDDPLWRGNREREYFDAVVLLRTGRCCDAVMRLAVFNELPPFLNPALYERAWEQPQIARSLERSREAVNEGLTLLAKHWQKLSAGKS